MLCAQFTDPRTYTQAPVGLNQLELDYAHAHSNSSIDTTLVVAGAGFILNEATVAYTHDFALLGHLAWVKTMFPFAHLNGSIAGDFSSSATGSGDLSIEFATLLQGGQALSMTEFAAYTPNTTMGVSLTITAPTGEYNADKLLNLGSNRWSFKPEFAVAYPFGTEPKW